MLCPGRLLSRDQYRLTKKERTLAIYDVPARLFTLKIMSKTAPPADRQAGLFVHKGYYAVSVSLLATARANVLPCFICLSDFG